MLCYDWQGLMVLQCGTWPSTAHGAHTSVLKKR